MSFLKTSKFIVAAGALALAPTALAADPSGFTCPSGTKQVGARPPQGDMLRCVSLKTGLAHGPMAFFSKDGRLEGEGQAVDGFRHGTFTTYDAQGAKSGTIEFQNGSFHGRKVELYPNGRVRRVENYVNGQRQGLVQEFDVTGKLVSSVEYRDGHPVTASK